MNILSYFKKDSTDASATSAVASANAALKTFDSEKFIVNKSLLQKQYSRFKSFLSTYPWQNEHFSLEAEFLEKAQQENIHISEVRLFLDLLEKDGSIKTY